MKNYLKYISFCLLAVVSFTSCEPDDSGYRDDPREVGGYAYLTTRTISAFDYDQDLQIELFTAEGVDVESVEIIHDGSTIANADVSGETASFNAADLGEFEAGDDFPVRVRANLSNGESSEDPATITVASSVGIDGDNPEAVEITEVDDVELVYTIFTSTASVEEVTLWMKNGEDAEYWDTGLELPTDGGTVAMSDIDYDELDLEVGDELYYQFAATRGDVTETAEEMIEILPEADDDEDDSEDDE